MFCFLGIGMAQERIAQALARYNSQTVPYITVRDLLKTEGFLLLDTRKEVEYQVSHLPNALWVGYADFNLEKVMEKVTDKNTPLVVYCSIGVRSEDIGEKLLAAGYTNVTNLFGGIFEWKNQGNAVYDTLNMETNKVHAYDKEWAKLLNRGEKVY